MDHSELTGLYFEAVVHRCLSLLDLDFIVTPSSESSITPAIPLVPKLACSVFQVASITTDLWHRHFGFLSQDATCDMLSQDFATGITLPTSSANVPTKHIPCPIGKSPQIPYLNNAR
jgi:hypothetical protein